MNRNEFTKVQNDMLDILADGMPHTREELHACLWDREGALANINMHITKIRKKLRPYGHDILCENVRRRTHYRHIILLPPSET